MDPQITIGGDAGQPYLVSELDSPAVKAFTAVLDSVEKVTQNKKVTLGTVGNDCGCGGGGCNPDTCDC